MSARRPELADVVRKHGPGLFRRFGGTLSSQQRRVLRAVASCRTSALGGHKRKCADCGHEEIAYNSCRDRHCPKCQASARSEWLKARSKDLLDVEYFHVVFTLPGALGPIALQNKKLVYGLLFRAVSETLLTIARDPKHLGAEIGFTAVLHTWGQNLELHPHVHCVVPGGGVSLDGTRWISCPKGFFLPVRVLSRLFRKKFLALLRQAYRDGEITFAGKTRYLAIHGRWYEFTRELDSTEWVVYAKPPFGGPEQVLAYLARYTHRVAISNQRLTALEGDTVTFQWKDYRRGQRVREMTLAGDEFLRRFLLHVLPAGFQRIRHFGFLANRVRCAKISRCRELLCMHQRQTAAICAENVESSVGSANESRRESCPRCNNGRMLVVEEVGRERVPSDRGTLFEGLDTS